MNLGPAAYRALLNETEEESTLEENTYFRLPANIIGNELYVAAKRLQQIFEGQKNGNDFDVKEFDSLINSLQKISKSAKRFNAGDELPLVYTVAGAIKAGRKTK